jgi:serine/threonine protein kinase
MNIAGVNIAMMNMERWHAIESLVESALELKANDRRAFLDKACVGDQSLRSELESLLAVRERAGDVTDKALVEEGAMMLARDGDLRKTLTLDKDSTRDRQPNATTLIEDRRKFGLAPGATLDRRYMIERELGRGGIAQVMLARDLKLPGGPPVVIKVLLEQTLERQDRDWFEKKFRAEIEALARINHPGVVSALDAGRLPDGRAYFVMQYVPGWTLRSVMPPHGMKPKHAADLLRKIAPALDAAHERGVIHRDLKPANIMLQTTGREEYIRIIDFGIATLLERSSAAMSKQTRSIGTLPYMAPEQLKGRPTAASDVFALGVIVFEMVTGQLPFNADTTAKQIELQRAGVEERLRKLREGLPEAARAVILKAMAFKASNRYRSAREFSEAFDRALAESARPSTFHTTSIPPESRWSRPPRQSKSPKGRLLALATALIVALLTVATVGTIAWQLLAPAKEKTVANPVLVPSAASERVLSVALLAQKAPILNSGSRPFIPRAGATFKAGDQARMILAGPQDGYLYVINEGPERAGAPPDFVVMFPSAGRSARVAANQTIQIPTPSGKPETDWFVFNEEAGVEKIWLIWSEKSVAEMEEIKSLVNPKDKGFVSDPNRIKRVTQYLKTLAETKVVVENDETRGLTRLKGRGEILAGVVRLIHK